jgi:flavin-dependent dehydrogenase
MISEERNYDLIIVGGGLAGSFLALNMKRKHPHLSVAIIEQRAHFPQKIGESLVDMTAIYVKRMGLNHLLQKHVVKSGIRFLFNESNSELPDDQSEFASPTFPGFIRSYHLNRQVFDEDVLTEAQQLGVIVFRPAQIQSLESSEFNNRLRLKIDDSVHEITSKWLVDASGRERFVHKQLGWKDQAIVLKTDAIMAHFTHVSPSTIWDTSTNPFWDQNAVSPRKFSTTHFMRENKWWWLIRLDEHLTSIGVVVNKDVISVSDPEAFFMNELRTDPQLKQLTAHATMTNVRHIPQLAYVSENIHSKGIALIGESGAFIDPLISPGLELIGQQSIWLTDLIGTHLKTGRWHDRRWKHYEQLFLKSYHNRIEIYRSAYPVMGSYPLFSAWLMQGNVLYFGKLVFPSIVFPNRLKYPLRFNFIDRLAFRYFRWRFHSLYNKWKNNPKRKPSKGAIRYSGVRVPRDWRFPFIPIVLLLQSLIAYLKIELTRD